MRRRRARARHRSRSGGHCRRPAPSPTHPWDADAVEGRFGELDRIAAADGLCAGRRRRARHRRVVDAARRPRARLLLPGRRAARHAHVEHRRRPRPMSSTRRRRAHSPTSCSTWARSAARAPSRARIVAAPGRAAVRAHAELAELAARVLGREKIAGRHAATRTFQALRIYVNDELGELARGACRGRAGAGAGRAAGRRDLPFAGGPARQALPEARGRPRSAARAICRRPNAQIAQPSFRFVNQRPVSPTSKEIDANPRARSAKLRAAVRTDAPAWPPPTPAISRIPRLERVGVRTRCRPCIARSIWFLMLLTLASAVRALRHQVRYAPARGRACRRRSGRWRKPRTTSPC